MRYKLWTFYGWLVARPLYDFSETVSWHYVRVLDRLAIKQSITALTAAMETYDADLGTKKEGAK